MAKTVGQVLAGVTQTEQVVTCSICGERHPLNSKDFIILYGDVMVGLADPAIAGNIDEKGKIVGSVVFCTKHEFVPPLVEELRKIVEGRTDTQKEEAEHADEAGKS
jgi:hypothetical protein